MKTDSLNVYERPVAEEVKLAIEFPIAGSGDMEDPDDPGVETPI